MISWALFFVSYVIVLHAFWKDVDVALVMGLLMMPGYLVLTAALRVIYGKIKVERLKPQIFPIILVSCVGAAFCQIILAIPALEIVATISEKTLKQNRSVARLVFHSMVFFGWSLAHLWLKSEREVNLETERRGEASAAAERAELQMLRFQLNPHFLFNSLNGIITEIQDRPPVALEMTHRLAEYLRHTLEFRGELLVPLRHEVSGAREYLEIERDRFGELLEVSFDVPEELGDVLVPSFLLQPLVENAVKYGRKTEAQQWQVSVELKAEGETLNIQVRNHGSLSDQKSDLFNERGKAFSGGVGLDVLLRRLALHYPGRHDFSLKQEGKYVCARIVLTGRAR